MRIVICECQIANYDKREKRSQFARHQGKEVVIPFDEMDLHLQKLGRDRAWLARQSLYSEAYVRDLLAPGSLRRNERVQKILSDVIHAEGKLSERPHFLPFSSIFYNEKEADLADRASRIAGAPSLIDFCHDVIQSESLRILRDAKANRETQEE